MAEPAEVVTVGDALIDELRTPDGISRFVGGAGLNVAVGLSRLGIRSVLIATVGDDDDGRMIREHLDEHGVQLYATTNPLGTSVAVSDRTDGEPRYAFSAAAQARLLDFDSDQTAALDGARFVAVTCFPFDDAQQTAALTAAVAHPESRLVLDPNPRSGMLRSATAFATGFESLARRSLLTKIGSEDAELLYGRPLDAVRGELVRQGAQTVVATAGADGAEVSSRSGVQVHAPIADVPGPLVDTMGAGDATLAALIASIARHGIPANAAEWSGALAEAMEIAALTCRQRGALLQLPGGAGAGHPWTEAAH
jgi:fructokinase